MTEQLDTHVNINTNLNVIEKQELKKLLHKYKHVFIDNPMKPPEAILVAHVIDMGSAQPTRDKMRRLPSRWLRQNRPAATRNA